MAPSHTVRTPSMRRSIVDQQVEREPDRHRPDSDCQFQCHCPLHAEYEFLLQQSQYGTSRSTVVASYATIWLNSGRRGQLYMKYSSSFYLTNAFPSVVVYHKASKQSPAIMPIPFPAPGYRTESELLSTSLSSEPARTQTHRRSHSLLMIGRYPKAIEMSHMKTCKMQPIVLHTGC